MSDTQLPTPPNARMVDLGGGLFAEMMADQSQLFFDPTTENVRAIFNGQPYLKTGDVYRRVGDKNDILHVDLKDLMALRPAPFRDPITGADMSNVTVAGVMLIMKAAYDYFYNKRAMELAEAESVSGPNSSTIPLDEIE